MSQSTRQNQNRSSTMASSSRPGQQMIDDEILYNKNNSSHNSNNNNDHSNHNHLIDTTEEEEEEEYYNQANTNNHNNSTSYYHSNRNQNNSSMMMFDDSVDLGEQLSSQIEYNNQLLRTIQDMERKSQEQNRLMSKKDQDLRMLRTEISNLRSQLDSVHDQTSAISQQMESQKSMYEDMVEREREEMNRKMAEKDDDVENMRSQMDQQLYQMQENILEKESMIRRLEEEIKVQQDNMKAEQNRRMENQSVQIDEMKRNYYTYLGTIQKQLREFALISQELRDKYNHTHSKLNTLNMMKNTLLEFETSNSEILMRDLNSSHQERQLLLENSQQGSDKIQDLEVQLEEERAKSIMLEEKTSRLEQQYSDLQRRSEKELDDAVRKANTQIRIINDSIGKLQLQLEEKEKLLTMIQKERSIVVEEKQELEKEYMELLSRSSSSSSFMKSSSDKPRKGLSTTMNSSSLSSHNRTGSDRMSQLVRKDPFSRSSMLSSTSLQPSSVNFMSDMNSGSNSSGIFSSRQPMSNSSIPPMNNRYSIYHMNTSMLDSSMASTVSTAQENTRHNEEMEEIYNKTHNLQEKLKEASAFQQSLVKDLGK